MQTSTTKRCRVWYFLFPLLTLMGCQGIYEDANDKAADYKSIILEISSDSLRRMSTEGKEFTLIDVRQSDDFYGGAIEGAVSIPRGMLEFKITDEEFWNTQYLYPPEKSSVIVVYSQDGSTGVLACEQLKSIGYINTINLKGGYQSFGE